MARCWGGAGVPQREWQRACRGHQLHQRGRGARRRADRLAAVCFTLTIAPCRGQANGVAALVRDVLAERELRPGDIGIITPYAAQARLLRRVLRLGREPGGLEVASVDGFQGACCVRCEVARCNADHAGWPPCARVCASATHMAGCCARTGREKELIIFSAVRANKSTRVRRCVSVRFALCVWPVCAHRPHHGLPVRPAAPERVPHARPARACGLRALGHAVRRAARVARLAGVDGGRGAGGGKGCDEQGCGGRRARAIGSAG